jgi:hypothetical protein
MEETEEIPYLVNNLSNKIELIRKWNKILYRNPLFIRI